MIINRLGDTHEKGPVMRKAFPYISVVLDLTKFKIYNIYNLSMIQWVGRGQDQEWLLNFSLRNIDRKSHYVCCSFQLFIRMKRSRSLNDSGRLLLQHFNLLILIILPLAKSRQFRSSTWHQWQRWGWSVQAPIRIMHSSLALSTSVAEKYRPHTGHVFKSIFLTEMIYRWYKMSKASDLGLVLGNGDGRQAFTWIYINKAPLCHMTKPRDNELILGHLQ